MTVPRHLYNLDARSEDLPHAEVEATWRDELSKRIHDAQSGAVELLDFDESHQQIRAELIARCEPGYGGCRI